MGNDGGAKVSDERGDGIRIMKKDVSFTEERLEVKVKEIKLIGKT